MPDKREKWLPRGPSARREPSVSRKLACTPSPRTKSRPGAKKERMKVVTLHLGGPPITAALVMNNCIHFMSACIHSFIYYSLNSYYNLREKAILRNKRTNLKERLARRRKDPKLMGTYWVPGTQLRCGTFVFLDLLVTFTPLGKSLRCSRALASRSPLPWALSHTLASSPSLCWLLLLPGF